MRKLEGKVALVTGGSSGIGLASAQLFLAEGAQLAISGRDGAALAAAAERLGPTILALQSDAGDLAQVAAMMDQIAARFGRIDVLYINAGTAQAGPIDQVGEAEFDSMVDINFKGVFFTIQKALPLMREGATIVVTTSISNRLGSANFSVYGATKAALRSLVKSLGVELIARGIRINAVSPGPIATPMFDRFGLAPEAAEAKKVAIATKSPARRFGLPEEVARAALFLACDDSSYMVGEEIVVDGGMSLL